MPELPEVETTKLSLTPLIGETVIHTHKNRPNVREPIPDDLDKLVGLKLLAVHRRAKYLLLDFGKKAPEHQLLVHLGMSGSLGQFPTTTPHAKHDHCVIDFKNGTSLHYHDPRRFGMVMWANDAVSYLSNVGIEPLTDDFTAKYLFDIIHKNPTRPKTAPIKAVIMEQKIVVGVGNIYATECLFLSKIHPLTPANLLSLDELTTLVAHIKAILAKAIEKGGSTLKDFKVADNRTGYFQQTLLAYGRESEPCMNCHLPLEMVKVSGRASVFCPSCQPLKTT